ncbi:MAG TPA: flagellar biosynthesis protein FlhF [Halanaerobiales bacterium]|nr:flagellar biosynthesis protein FlhF [Halanaerobiales bacterium]
MKVKKYVGDTIQDTIFKVKADLGSDAIILNTRKYKKGGFLGLKIFGEKKVEVLAALEDDNSDVSNEKTLEEIDKLKNMLNNMERERKKEGTYEENLSPEIADIYNNLLEQGVKENIAQELIEDLKDDNEEINIDQLKNNIKSAIGNPAPINRGQSLKIIAFIGPTGVGKTTTIAKLAAKFALQEELEVGMVTADTYRIAAVQQLETYSDIMNIPLEVVYSEKELKEVINGKFEDFDLIFLDTAGSSWTDKMQLGRLKNFTDKDLVTETHLLISLNTKTEDINKILDNFSTLEPDKIILTKVDEASKYGDIINLRNKYNLPYSYITYGQDVPDDIVEADTNKLFEYLLGDNYE